ncbi:MBL fold metallo-hydrolase [Haloechinothrix salitolerans]|uniref:MBL fold metallo-hydrolase n=1 Tax=Haloechinothrix salitolerans TaxID=926830 RepID=A0ABW2BZ39_9PSEU
MPFDTQPWTEPGPQPVAPGVHRVPLPMPNDGLRAVNVYVIEDGDGVVLIDSGWHDAEAKEHLRGALAALGHDFRDVRRFLATHMHADHYTLAVALRKEYGTPITLGAGERESVEVILRGDTSRQLGEPRRWGIPGEVSMRDIGIEPSHSREAYELPDEWLDRETDIALTSRTLRAVPTPGHTAGHIVFADEAASLLFSGDHVLPHITPSIGFQPSMRRNALTDYLASLRLLLELPDMMLLPAHGPVTDSAHVRVKELLNHHDERLDATRETVVDGATTAYESASRLTWTGKHRAFDTLEMFNQFLAVGETAAHLEHLVTTGVLEQTVRDGVAHYRP